MSRCVVLGAEAFSALAGKRSRRQQEVRGAMAAAARLHRDVIVPAVVLAEPYRGPNHSSLLDACLSRETGIVIRSTDRAFARLVGGVLAGAGAGSERIVDAHVVAAAVEAGGGIVMTSDPTDLTRLASAYRNIHVIDITSGGATRVDPAITCREKSSLARTARTRRGSGPESVSS